MAAPPFSPLLSLLPLQVVRQLETTGVLVVRDPRVTFEDNATFIDMMEDYFSQDEAAKAADVKPEIHFQLGATPGGNEVPLPVDDRVATLGEDAKPTPVSGADPKWRFFWRIGDAPTETAFPALAHPQVVPAAFPQWPSVMDSWGTGLLAACRTVTELLALGYGMERSTIARLLHEGPHKLAPTGTDMSKHGGLHTVMAGFHQDLNLLTIHGKSRYPGLYVWLRDGTKTAVVVPEGCLILQAGMQLEYLTGGKIEAGFHEVVVTEGTMAAIEKQKAAGRPLWRVSSTLFSHVASDETLSPIEGKFDRDDARFPPVKTGAFVLDQLQKRALRRGK